MAIEGLLNCLDIGEHHVKLHIILVTWNLYLFFMYFAPYPIFFLPVFDIKFIQS